MYKNKEQRNEERYGVKQEVLRMIKNRDLSLIRVGHMFILRGKLGSVFQSHDINEIKQWVLRHRDRPHALKYGNLRTL